MHSCLMVKKIKKKKFISSNSRNLRTGPLFLSSLGLAPITPRRYPAIDPLWPMNSSKAVVLRDNWISNSRLVCSMSLFLAGYVGVLCSLEADLDNSTIAKRYVHRKSEHFLSRSNLKISGNAVLLICWPSPVIMHPLLTLNIKFYSIMLLIFNCCFF